MAILKPDFSNSNFLVMFARTFVGIFLFLKLIVLYACRNPLLVWGRLIGYKKGAG
jgi:hypothetical protein